MITNRSNHMPMLTKIDTTNTAAKLLRTLFSQSTCGITTLHTTIVQYAGANGPAARLRKTNCS